jgi:hypothetical protein
MGGLRRSFDRDAACMAVRTPLAADVAAAA